MVINSQPSGLYDKTLSKMFRRVPELLIRETKFCKLNEI